MNLRSSAKINFKPKIAGLLMAEKRAAGGEKGEEEHR